MYTYSKSKAGLSHRGLTTISNAFSAIVCPSTYKLTLPDVCVVRLHTSVKIGRGGLCKCPNVKGYALSNENYLCRCFLFQSHNWITIGMKAEAPVGIDVHNVLCHILLLLAKSVSHAIASSANVWECYGSCRVRHGLGWTFDFLVCNLHVDVGIHSGGAEIHGNVPM